MRKQTLILSLLLLITLAQSQTLRYFEFTTSCGHGNWQDTAFIAATSDQAVIDSVLANLAKPLSQRKFISGPIDYGNGGFNYNGSHSFSWHHIPNQWSLVELAIEVCDGCPYTDLDANPAYWVDTIGQYCPWTGIPVREVQDPVGINRTIQNEIRIYPNPASDRLVVEQIGPRAVTLILYNALGQQLLQIDQAQKTEVIDISHFHTGIYFLKVTDGGSGVIKKVLVENPF